MRRVILGLLTSLSLLCVGIVGAADPAVAADGCHSATCAGSEGGGFTATAVVHFSGDAAPGGGGSVSMGVPATCWWEVYGAAPSDPTQWQKFYDEYVSSLGPSSTVIGAYWQMGPEQMWTDAAARAAAGEKLTVYHIDCRDGTDLCTINEFSGGAAQGKGGMGGDCGVAPMVGFFPPGNPPAPLVAPEDLAKLARDHMQIPDPVVDRNPKVGAVGQGTLVGLPTWFWVTNPASVGGANGTRTIRAEVGAVWAQVVAKTDGLTVTSPAGGTSCPPSVASTPYTAGASDSSGCTVDFRRASVGYSGGYPVDASTAWTATWTGSGGTGGGLDGLARTAQVAVPVAESQALVSGS